MGGLDVETGGRMPDGRVVIGVTAVPTPVPTLVPKRLPVLVEE